MTRAAVIGAGSWGTALALHLARTGTPVRLWARRPEQAGALRRDRENRTYLPGASLPDEIVIEDRLEAALRDATAVLFVVPVQAARGIFAAAAPSLPAGADLVIAAKGIEEESLLRPSEILRQALGDAGLTRPILALSGPSFAAEVARGDPTAVVVAGEDEPALHRVQAMVSRGALRAYRNADLAGVEVAGALKNVMAIATGIAEGIGFGSNTRAAIITRGLAEIARLGTALGGRAATFAGLAGAGDLILTCTGALSRNRSVGIEIGRGRSLAEVLAGMRMVAEGVATTRAAVALARRNRLELPIAEQVHSVLFGGRPPREAVADLLARPLREES